MHPELSKRLVLAQLEEALTIEGLFSKDVQLEEAGYPLFFVRFTNKHSAIRLIRFDAENYDFQAIAIEPVDPISREQLPPDKWMRRNGGDFPSHHMKEGRPFLCIAGTRDYYTHESHRPDVTNERWEKWRSEFRVPNLIKYIAEKFSSGDWE